MKKRNRKPQASKHTKPSERLIEILKNARPPQERVIAPRVPFYPNQLLREKQIAEERKKKFVLLGCRE